MASLESNVLVEEVSTKPNPASSKSSGTLNRNSKKTKNKWNSKNLTITAFGSGKWVFSKRKSSTGSNNYETSKEPLIKKWQTGVNLKELVIKTKGLMK